MSATPAISVVVCTLNRAGYLRTALESLVGQDAPGGFEVLVVDNGSTDETPAVARELAGRLPLRYVVERETGLCHARNTGWRAARGAVVAYFDDDAVAEPGWLAAIADGFALEPTAGAVGGRVVPIWEAPRPGWLSEHAARVLTIVDWSPAPKRIPDLRQEWLVGANMAVPRAVLAEIGGFHAGLDRVGTNMLSSGDVFLQEQIAALGRPIVYHPAMAIRHVVTPGRLTKAWFRRRYYWQGISDAVMQLIRDDPSPARRARLAARGTARLLASPRQLGALLLPTDDPERFAAKCWAWIAVGQVAGLLGAARR